MLKVPSGGPYVALRGVGSKQIGHFVRKRFPVPQFDAVSAGQISGLVCEIRGSDVQTLVGAVMCIDHSDECLDFGRANSLARRVALALHGDFVPPLVARPGIDMKISRSSHALNVSVTE